MVKGKQKSKIKAVKTSKAKPKVSKTKSKKVEKLEKRPRIIMKNLEFEECCQCGENVVCAEFKYCPMCGVTVCPSCGDLSYDNIMYKCCNKNCRE